MNLKNLLVALLATTVGFLAHAQENTTAGETTVNIEGTNSVEGNIDDEITNNKMRAESGSKSKVSASVGVTYSGGSLEDPGAADRLNLLGGDNLEQVDLNLSLNGRYRVNKNIVMGFVDPAFASDATEMNVDIVGEAYPARVVADSVFDPSNERVRS